LRARRLGADVVDDAGKLDDVGGIAANLDLVDRITLGRKDPVAQRPDDFAVGELGTLCRPRRRRVYMVGINGQPSGASSTHLFPR
jgi:hypothetical protein